MNRNNWTPRGEGRNSGMQSEALMIGPWVKVVRVEDMPVLDISYDPVEEQLNAGASGIEQTADKFETSPGPQI